MKLKVWKPYTVILIKKDKKGNVQIQKKYQNVVK